jgi:hypothetical protein
VWRSFFDPPYMPRWTFVEPVLVGVVLATILGIVRGWQGVLGGVLMGLFMMGLLGARYLLVRWATRNRNGEK